MHCDTIDMPIGHEILDNADDGNCQAEGGTERKTEQKQNEIDDGENGAQVIQFK